MEYLFLLVPLGMFMLSYFYKVKYNKLRGTGKVPVIVAAKRNTELFFMLAITLAGILIIVINYDWL